MAASSSIMVPTVRLILGGASSTRKRAMARLKGTARARAMRVETRVPKMLLAAPKDWVTGFQSSENKKPKPNCLIAGREELIRSTPMASITRGTNMEQAKVSQRNTVSPLAETRVRPPALGASLKGGGDSPPPSALRTLFIINFLKTLEGRSEAAGHCPLPEGPSPNPL